MVKCAGSMTEEFKVEVALHQGSALSSLLFAVVMERMGDEVRHESLWTMKFSDDFVRAGSRWRNI